MAVVCGIDEAGLGPVLGPLVATATAFLVPDEAVDDCLWQRLAPHVSSRPARGKRAAVAVCDSKKLYNRQSASGLGPLERGVLAMLASAGHRPKSLRSLLDTVCPQAREAMGAYPWYAEGDLAVPVRVGATEAALAGNAVKVALTRRGLALGRVASEVVCVGEFNRLIEATRNKHAAAFGITARLLRGLWDAYCHEPRLRVWVDRQGGRVHYLREIQDLFPGCDYQVLSETARTSAYRVTCGGRCLDLCFRVEAESAQLPVALASMVSKYLRELFMERLNGFWASIVPGLRPTAGYATDGKRFFEEIAPAVRAEGFSQHLLLRCR